MEYTNHSFEGPQYYTHRLKLMQVLNNYNTFTPTLEVYGGPHLKLQTNQTMFAAVHDYIKESDRFVTISN